MFSAHKKLFQHNRAFVSSETFSLAEHRNQNQNQNYVTKLEL